MRFLPARGTGRKRTYDSVRASLQGAKSGCRRALARKPAYGLRPGVDGVLVESGDCRGTFLPAVWAHLQDPWVFWRELKLKAGLPEDRLPEDLVVWRYEAESLG